MLEVKTTIHKTHHLNNSLLEKKKNVLTSINERALLLMFCKRHDKSLKNTKNLNDIIILNLNNQNLTKLPENLHLLINLEYLILHGNKLTTLPTSLVSLKNLREIWVCNRDDLRSLPVELSKLVILNLI